MARKIRNIRGYRGISSGHPISSKDRTMIRTIRPLAFAVLMACCCAHAQTSAPTPESAITTDTIAIGAAPYKVQVASGGSGRYTVIFESGFGTDLRTWRKVAPEVAKVARTVAYSRAGHGASDPRPEPRTFQQSTLELEQLVAAAGLAPPFILVGHSYGGLLVRAFAARHPGQVAGMVLVDPADERLNPALRKLDAARAAEDDRQFASFVPPKFQPELALLQPLLDSGALPLDGKVPDVPVVVLTSTRQVDKPMFFVETAQALAAKRELHASFVRQFRHGAQVLTSKSGHNIQLEEPELVVAAVNEVIVAADKDLAQARD
jgi:pimeloyl-ACP methyl ester carboxylesterase